MKKLFKRLGALAAAVLLPILLLNALYVRTAHFRTENGVSDFARVPGNLELVNTGSSHGKYGFRYEELADTAGFNLAMEAQPFVYDFAMLRQFGDRLRPGAVVLLSVSIESFHRYPEATPQIKPRYYRILSRRNTPDYHVGDALRYSILPVLGAGRNIAAIWKDTPPEENAFLHASLGGCTADKLEQMAGIRYEDTRVVVIDQANEAVQADNVQRLGDMVRFCRESGWVPVLVTTPFVRALDGQYSDAFRAEFDRRLEAVRAASGNPPFLDYSRDSRFVDSPELFADVDHLNARGATEFTRRVVGDLRGQGLLPPRP